MERSGADNLAAATAMVGRGMYEGLGRRGFVGGGGGDGGRGEVDVGEVKDDRQREGSRCEGRS